ncbi:MAG: hypothetical protein QOF94_2848, partial [Acidobacteriaceae bacterium]
YNCLQQVRRPKIVHSCVIGDLIHGLSNADGSGKVKDDFHIANGLPNLIKITHVCLNELRFSR